MLDQSTRINAVIAYLFLWPLLLFVRAGTPLAEPYVRAHARRASLIILFGFLALWLYFALRSYLIFSIFGISLATIVLVAIMSVFLVALLAGAYGAFRGVDARETSWRSLSLPTTTMNDGTYSEEDKVRIVASFFPFFGTIIAEKYPMPETITGRKVGNWSTLLIITSIVFLSGSTATMTFVVIIAYIALIVATAVYLFGHSRFLALGVYQMLPTYLELDAHAKAIVMTTWDFIRTALGREKGMTYRDRYGMSLTANRIERKAETDYFAPAWIVAIPLVNLLTIPSFLSEKYREYRPLILQWLFLTTLFLLIVWRYGWSSEMWLYLVFPIVSLGLYASKNILTRAPITSIMVDTYQLFTHGKSQVAEMQKQEEKVKFSYGEKEQVGDYKW